MNPENVILDLAEGQLAFSSFDRMLWRQRLSGRIPHLFQCEEDLK